MMETNDMPLEFSMQGSMVQTNRQKLNLRMVILDP